MAVLHSHEMQKLPQKKSQEVTRGGNVVFFQI